MGRADEDEFRCGRKEANKLGGGGYAGRC